MGAEVDGVYAKLGNAGGHPAYNKGKGGAIMTLAPWEFWKSNALDDMRTVL
jgi:hypothetical protein